MVHQTPIVQERIIQQKVVEPVVQQKVVQETIVQHHEPIVQHPVQHVTEVRTHKVVDTETHHDYKLKSHAHSCIHCHDVPKVSLRITECPPGHYLSADHTHCKHIDCEPGLKFDDHLLKCVDIDECVVSHPCLHDEICHNTHGSYYCKKVCTQSGYRLNQLTNTCEDINECLEHTHSCGPQQICVNRLGKLANFLVFGKKCFAL